MKRLVLINIIVVLFIAAPLALSYADESEALKKLIEQSRVEHDNPHLSLACSSCHGTDEPVADAEGNVPFAQGDITQTCYSCHDKTSNIHPVDRLPSMKVPENLPLYKGRVSCGTCHDLHMKRTKDHLLRGFADGKYKARPDLCIDCHGERFIKKNPHVNQKERGLCVFCHQTEPSKMDNEKTVRFRFGILRTCNFCHNMVAQNHPVNVDREISPPRSLPRDIDGSVTCATCHNPHGTADTLHNLRREYIVSLESSQNFNPHKNDCGACHLGRPPAKGTPMETIYKGLRFNGAVGLLCNSCHGMHNIHPVDIKPAPDMKVPDYLPLDGKGRVFCITCHNLNCGEGKVTLRLFDEKTRSVQALCFSCHDEKKFTQTNPHQQIAEGKGCLFCHERQPDAKSDRRDTVGFITSLRLICIRCHERYPHPASTEHLVMPQVDLPKDMPVDDSGSITCITCHNPHIGGATSKDKRLRRPGEKLCDVCHASKY